MEMNQSFTRWWILLLSGVDRTSSSSTPFIIIIWVASAKLYTWPPSHHNLACRLLAEWCFWTQCSSSKCPGKWLKDSPIWDGNGLAATGQTDLLEGYGGGDQQGQVSYNWSWPRYGDVAIQINIGDIVSPADVKYSEACRCRCHSGIFPLQLLGSSPHFHKAEQIWQCLRIIVALNL